MIVSGSRHILGFGKGGPDALITPTGGSVVGGTTVG